MFLFFENTGNAKLPAFVQRSGVANPLSDRNVGTLSTTALGDVDADGDLEVFAGDRAGHLTLYLHKAGDLVDQTGAANPLNGADVGTTRAPRSPTSTPTATSTCSPGRPRVATDTSRTPAAARVRRSSIA